MSDPGAAARPVPAPCPGPRAPEETGPGDGRLPADGVRDSASPAHGTLPPSPGLRAVPARYRPSRRGLGIVGAFLLAGLLLACLWWALAPILRDLSDPAESAVATDGTLLCLELLAGAVTGAGLLLRPGPAPARRLVEVLVLTALGSVTGWFVVDRLTDAGPLNALGILLVWPLTASAVVTLGSARVLFSWR